MNHLTKFVVLAATAASLGATGGEDGCGTPGPQVTRDPGFDLWCGDQLCAWKVFEGDVKKVPTWHEKDAGVALLGTNAGIEQTAPVDMYDATCLRFSLLSRSATSVQLQLEVDINGDGSVETVERFPAGNWQKLVYDLKLATPYRGVRFAITKAGTGEAEVAQLDVKTASDGCEGFTPIVAEKAPIGALCGRGPDLHGEACGGPGICVDNAVSEAAYRAVCAACNPSDSSTCMTNEVCGQIEPTSAIREPSFACAAKHSDPLGAACRTDEECASNICTNHVCSTCRSDHPCANSESCAVAYVLGPATCMPGVPIRAAGEPCTNDRDCISEQCDGADRYQCPDGRSCGNAQRELCPAVGFASTDPTADGLQPGACTLVGIEGGTCR